MATLRRTPVFAFARIMLGLVVLLPLSGCGEKQLVEVFDNGPVGGPRGESQGYIWVDPNEMPPPGHTWAPVDETTLTPEQKKRIRN